MGDKSLFTKVAIAGVLTIVTTGAGCTATPTPPANTNTTANVSTTIATTPLPDKWETFSSRLMDYTLSYPAAWHTWSGSESYDDLDSAESDVDYLSILPKEQFSTISPDQILIAINLTTKQDGQSLNDVITQASTGMQISAVKPLVLAKTLPAVQEVETDPRDAKGEYGYHVVTYVDADKVVYTISITSASKEAYAQYQPIIQKITESFQLTTTK